MKSITLFYTITLLSVQCIFSQENSKSYIQKDVYTKIITVYELSYPSEDIMSINVFKGEIDKVQWGSAISIISYRFLGIDNQNNLHIQRTEKDYVFKKEDVCELIFKLELNKPTDIVLIGQRSQLKPLLIKIQVEVENNFIKSKYLGDFPTYTE